MGASQEKSLSRLLSRWPIDLFQRGARREHRDPESRRDCRGQDPAEQLQRAVLPDGRQPFFVCLWLCRRDRSGWCCTCRSQPGPRGCVQQIGLLLKTPRTELLTRGFALSVAQRWVAPASSKARSALLSVRDISGVFPMLSRLFTLTPCLLQLSADPSLPSPGGSCYLTPIH